MKRNNNQSLRIMSQNKNFITSLGRECWIVSYINNGVLFTVNTLPDSNSMMDKER